MRTKHCAVLGAALAISFWAQPMSVLAAEPAVAAAGSNAPAASFPPPSPLSKATMKQIQKMKPIFDGKTLRGWVQAPLNATALSGNDITDLPVLAKKLTDKSDPVSALLNQRLDAAIKTELAGFTSESTNSKAVKTALSKSLNTLISGPSLYDEAAFKNVQLRKDTAALRKQKPDGQKLARLNRMLLEDAYPKELAVSSTSQPWIVKQGAMASQGVGRGTIYTEKSYGNYRVIFNMRHVSGKPDHQACALIFCTPPPAGQKGLDALGGIQLQPPNGGTWDYRPGKNNDGKGLFTRHPHPKYDNHEWAQVEILVNVKGTARMAVAQPPGTKAVEVVNFTDPTAGKEGPLAWQMHNAGLFDEFKDVRIEENPKTDKLITVE